MTWATYVGPIRYLAKKTALLLPDPDEAEQVLAQFDDTNLDQSHGWHKFPRFHFRVLDESEPS